MQDFLPFVPAPECDNSQLLIVTAIYGYILFSAAGMIGDGSELLLLVPAYADLVGSVVLPILGAVPDGMMILFSGLGPREVAQEQVSVGVGALAGSTIMLLTLAWFVGVLGGRVNVQTDGSMGYGAKVLLSPSHSWSLKGCGVKVGSKIAKNGRVMMITALLFFFAQGPAFLMPSKDEMEEAAKKEGKSEMDVASSFVNFPSALGLLACGIAFFVYLYLQTLPDDASDADAQLGSRAEKIIATKFEAIKRGDITLRGVMYGVARGIAERSEKEGSSERFSAPLLETGSNDARELRKLCRPFFEFYDTDRNNKLCRTEFSKIMCDLRENLGKDVEDTLFSSADVDGSGSIDFDEFADLMVRYCRGETGLGIDEGYNQIKPGSSTGLSAAVGVSLVADVEAGNSAEKEDEEEEEDEMPEDLQSLSPEEQQKAVKLRACWLMGLGTILVLVFSDPAVEVLNEIGKRTGVPSFYVSFVLAPLASNASELVATYKYASKKTVSSMTIAISTLLGAACMNNTFCLGIFYMLVYAQQLQWNFTAEILVIVLVQFVVGFFTQKEVQLFRDAVFIIALYPLSIAFVWAMNNVIGVQ